MASTSRRLKSSRGLRGLGCGGKVSRLDGDGKEPEAKETVA